jgi:hypothetical protein
MEELVSSREKNLSKLIPILLETIFKIKSLSATPMSVSRFQEKEKRGEMITKNYNIK